jgi:hypothetical protein
MVEITRQQAAAIALVAAISDTIKECPNGAPGGILYMAMMQHGCSYQTFTDLMSLLLRLGHCHKRGDCYFWGPAKVAPTQI